MDSTEYPSYSLEQQLKGLIDNLDAYISTYHGGKVELVSFDGKHVKVKFGEACVGCPYTSTTLHGWIEGTLRQFFPEIETVEEVKE